MDFVRLLREIGGSGSGLVGRLKMLTSDLLLPADKAALDNGARKITDLLFSVENDFNDFVHSMETFMEDLREGQPVSNYGQQTRIVSATRTLPAWGDVEISWDNVNGSVNASLALVGEFHNALTDTLDDPGEDVEDTLSSLASVNRRLTEARETLNALVSEPDERNVYWVEIQPNTWRLVFQAAPLNVGPLMEQYLWHEKSSIILTSATLTTNNEFD